ncbi:MAG: RpiB/LacA/LacB family sugar-phosphate isomerase [Armatimonadetes bacterium]|nr:RpiB/LacA/LacB family sugar-phosphate isomerase [Anaerolineae bacterium]
MKLVLAGDHAGFTLKQHLIAHLRQQGHDVTDLGVTTGAVPADYPDSAMAVAEAIGEGHAERGILVCGSGIGACIAANKFPGIYASIAHDVYSAGQGVVHDNMNVLCLGGRIIGTVTAEALVEAFVNAQFAHEERFVRRFNQVQAIEQRNLT